MEKVEFIESYIKHGNDYQWNDNHGELIRCKDCTHRPTKPAQYKNGFDLDFPDDKCPCKCADDYYSWYPADTWYCANAERKDND